MFRSGPYRDGRTKAEQASGHQQPTISSRHDPLNSHLTLLRSGAASRLWVTLDVSLKYMLARHTLLTLCIVGALSGCASVESIPKVNVLLNDSAIQIADSRDHGPESFLGAIGLPPDIPSGTTIALKRIEPLHNKEPRYFIPASGRLKIVSLENQKKYNLTKSLDAWKTLLDADVPQSEMHGRLERQLSEIPWMNAGRCFHAKLQKHTFAWGKAILFLTSYVQGKTGGPVNNDMLVLVVQGVTFDGKYAVNGHFEIRHPRLPTNSWDERKQGKAVFDIDDETEQAEKWLSTQPDSSFNPSIQTYLSLLNALRIAPKSKRGQAATG
jgi:hypothetical protein